MFGLAGLPELRKVMHESHPSSLRIFNEVVLERLSADEVNRVIDLCLNEANRSNAVAKSIADDGRYLLGMFSEGYPHFIQQFGYSALPPTETTSLIYKMSEMGRLDLEAPLNKLVTATIATTSTRRFKKKATAKFCGLWLKTSTIGLQNSRFGPSLREVIPFSIMPSRLFGNGRSSGLRKVSSEFTDCSTQLLPRGYAITPQIPKRLNFLLLQSPVNPRTRPNARSQTDRAS